MSPANRKPKSLNTALFMVIGNGLIANAFHTLFNGDNRYVIFASGVSNSSCTDKAEFDREIKLLSDTLHEHPDKHLVYFSTCSIYDPSMQGSAYIKHKLHAEHLITNSGVSYSIFRVPNLIGFTPNPYTLLNYLFRCVEKQIPFQIWKNSCRYFIDVDDLVRIVMPLLQSTSKQNKIINIAYPEAYPIYEIVEIIEQFLQKTAKAEPVDKGASFHIPIDDQQELDPWNATLDRRAYLLNLLNKYYWAS